MGKIIINKGQGGVGAEPTSLDHVSGFIFQQIGISADIGPVKIYTLEDAESAGITADACPVEHYHLKTYYAMRQKITGLAQGEAYVLAKDITTTTFDGTEIQTLQDFASGRIRQVAVYLEDPYLSSYVTACQTYAETVTTDGKPLSVLFGADFSSIASTALADARSLDSENVSVVIGEDGAGAGYVLRQRLSRSITNIGTVMGALSSGNVHENLQWRSKFNVSVSMSIDLFVDSGQDDSGVASKLTEAGQNFQTTVEVGDKVYNTTDDTTALVTAIDSDTVLSLSSDIMDSSEDYVIVRQGQTRDENETVGFATSDTPSTTAALEALTDFGYIFMVKDVGFNGTYINDTPTCTLSTSDFLWIERMRVIDKAVRAVREKLQPKIGQPIYINADDGTISGATIEDFKSDAFAALEVMASNGEISTQPDGNLPANTVVIDPAQDVLATSNIELTIQIVPVGTARTITANINFAVSVE